MVWIFRAATHATLISLLDPWRHGDCVNAHHATGRTLQMALTGKIWTRINRNQLSETVWEFFTAMSQILVAHRRWELKAASARPSLVDIRFERVGPLSALAKYMIATCTQAMKLVRRYP